MRQTEKTFILKNATDYLVYREITGKWEPRKFNMRNENTILVYEPNGHPHPHPLTRLSALQEGVHFRRPDLYPLDVGVDIDKDANTDPQKNADEVNQPNGGTVQKIVTTDLTELQEKFGLQENDRIEDLINTPTYEFLYAVGRNQSGIAVEETMTKDVLALYNIGQKYFKWMIFENGILSRNKNDATLRKNNKTP